MKSLTKILAIGSVVLFMCLGGCTTRYYVRRAKVKFEPQASIDVGLPLSRKVTLAIAPFADCRPFVKKEEPRTLCCIDIDLPGFNVHKPVNWSDPKSYKGGVWTCTEENTSVLIQRLMGDVFTQTGFKVVSIGTGSEDEGSFLPLARAKGCEFLLTGTIKDFQTGDHAGAVGGFYYLHQTIRLDVRLLRVTDGESVLNKTYEVDSEETEPGHKYYRLMRTVIGYDILLNLRFPPLLSRMIGDVKDAVSKSN